MRSKKATERLIKAVEDAGGEIRLKSNDKVVVYGPTGRAYIGTAVANTESWRNTMRQIERHTGLRMR